MTTFLGFHVKRDGYGEATIQIARAVQQIDPTLQVVNMDRRNGQGHEGDDARWRVDGTAIALCTPDWYPHIRAERLIGYTMFESSRLPAGWVDKINSWCNQLVVPCTWCMQVFAAAGVRVPIHVVKWGIDGDTYYPLDRRDHALKPYTFLWSGTPDQRKGWDVAYTAFVDAFGHRPDVRLILHFRHPLRFSGVEPTWSDPNVVYTVGLVDPYLQRLLLHEADCYVFPSRGEGWGLPPREAAATGLPVLATNAHGLAEEIEYWALAPIDTRGTSPAHFGWWDDIGEWVEPDTQQLAEWMEWCVQHRAESAAAGLRAAQWLKENTPWERAARGLIELVEPAAAPLPAYIQAE